MNVKTLLLVGSMIFMSCKNTNKELVDKPENPQSIIINSDCPDYLLKRKKENLNISVFVDLSNRIENKTQRFNDSAYIYSLSKVFNTHIKRKKLGLLYDKMEFFFDPTPSNQEINALTEELKISYQKGVSKSEWMPKTLNLYSTNPSKIYNLAIQDGKDIGYPGSDIWGFMKSHAKDYCVEECRRNILVILTDGYMYHKSSIRQNENRTSFLTPKSLDKLGLNKNSWKDTFEQKDLGFIPASKGLEDLEILVLGITNENPRNSYSNDIIEAYWEKWFLEMGIKTFKIKTADIPARIEQIIADFILNN